MSQVLSDRERSKRLNQFVQHNPQRSAWALKQWLEQSSETIDDINEPKTKVLHLIVRLEDLALSQLQTAFSEAEFFLLKSQAQTVITLGDLSLEALVYDFYETCKSFQPVILTQPIERIADNDLPKFTLPPNFEPSTYLSALDQVDPETLTHVLRREQTQVIALVVAHLKPELGAQVLAALKEEEQAKVCRSIGYLEKVSPEWLQAIEDTLMAEIKCVDQALSHMAMPHLAEIINHLSEHESEYILSELETKQEDLAQTLKDHLFTFKDLCCMDDRSMQKLLQKVDRDLWQVALRGADEQIQNKVFANLSQKAADILREDLSEQSARRVSEVHQAQADIVTIALEMEQAGEVVINHPHCKHSFVS